MSPIEYIEEGIREGNWLTVCEGYERLTGKALPLPVDRPGETRQAQEALSKIVGIASAILDENIAETIVNETIDELCGTQKKQTKKKNGNKKKSGKKKTKKKTTVNKDGEDESLQLDDNSRTPGKQQEAGEVHLITNEPDPEEVEKNKIKAAKSSRNKLQLNREEARTHEVKCNECQETFSSTRPGGEMGQKCRKCLNGQKSRFV